MRAGCVLAALVGNVGIAGGWASGLGNQAPDGGPFWTVFPTGENPFGAAIPCFLWTEAVLRGREMGEADGVVFSGSVARGRDAAALFGATPGAESPRRRTSSTIARTAASTSSATSRLAESSAAKEIASSSQPRPERIPHAAPGFVTCVM